MFAINWLRRYFDGVGMSEQRYAALDAFRGVAVLSVMSFHYFVRWAPPISATNLYGYSLHFSSVFDAGYLGVHLFFVISGIVITMTVLRSSDAIDFAARRLARLYPALFIAAILTFAVTSASHIGEFRTSIGDLLASLTMDPADLHKKAVDGAYWSLAIEIKFYAWVALSFWLLGKRFWIAIVAVAIAGFGVALTGHGGIAESLFVASYMPLFLAGMGTWFLAFENKFAEAIPLYAVAVLLYALDVGGYAKYGLNASDVNLYILPLVAAMCGILLLAPHLHVPLLPWIGRVSYSLYLVHQFIGVTIIHEATLVGVPDLLAAALAAAICVVLAWTLYENVEGPGKRVVMEYYRRLRFPVDAVPQYPTH